MKCKYLKIRSKKYQKYLYCSLLKKEIDSKNCSVCNDKEYKTIKKHKQKIKKTIVLKETYNTVINRDHYSCRLCNNISALPSDAFNRYIDYHSKLVIRNENLQLHHIYYRSERKDLINDVSNCIMLCTDCHRLVHSNKHIWQEILLEMNK